MARCSIQFQPAFWLCCSAKVMFLFFGSADGFLGVRVLCARSELQLVGVELFFWARNQLQIGFGPSVSSIDVEFSVGFLVVFW